jgi:hypothetical protein
MPTYVSSFLATRNGVALLKAFMKLEKPLRRSVVNLIEQITPEGEDWTRSEAAITTHRIAGLSGFNRDWDSQAGPGAGHPAGLHRALSRRDTAQDQFSFIV